MARLPLASRESVPEDQRAAFDEVVKGYNGSVPRYGPGSIMINVPKAHQLVIALNRHLRNSPTLSKKLQELAMIVTARELDCQYIWNAHAASARAAGVADAAVDALRDRKELPKLPADEGAVVRFGQELLRARRVSKGSFQAAIEQFGKEGAVELCLLFGNYSQLAMIVNAFDVDLPPERKEPLLPV
jgi:4-carboxymuconolactone decarboxylase